MTVILGPQSHLYLFETMSRTFKVWGHDEQDARANFARWSRGCYEIMSVRFLPPAEAVRLHEAFTV